jgi:Alpha/beta hydrolase domain
MAGKSGNALKVDRRSILAGGSAATLASLTFPSFALGQPARIAPRFAGPILVTAASKPWATAMAGGAKEAMIKHFDYVEEEYFVSGTCGVYGPGGSVPTGADQASPIVFAAQLRPLAKLMRSGVPYTTRAIVLRPRDFARFSGRVHLIPNHNLAAETRTDKFILRGGDVWIGLEVNSGTRFGLEERPSGGIAHLRQYDAERYGGLSIPAGLPTDWPGLLPGRLGEAYKTLDLGGRQAAPEKRNIFRQEISRSYAQAPDIMTDVAALLRSGGPTSPLAGHKVRRIFTSGSSGQSTILTPYVDYHHEAARLRYGHVPFDGYMIRVGVWPATRPTGSVLVQVQSEAEAMKPMPPGELERLANTDDPMFRFYEIPGVGHGLTSRAPSPEGGIGQLVPEGVIGISQTAGETEFQRYDKIALPVQWAMWANMDEWLEKGVPMPRTEPCKRDPDAPDGLARDQFGNVIGGLRLPWMDVPDAQYIGIIQENNPLEGGMKPFSEARMKELYGSREAYLAKLDEKLQQMVRERLILAEDIPLMRLRGDTEALNLGLYEA